MRIRFRPRGPSALGAFGVAGAGLLRLWLGTLQFRYRPLGPDVDPRRRSLGARFIYAMWHETLLLPVQRFARSDISVLVSTHADAELIAQICRRLRVGVVRGSTTRGGVEALRGLLARGRRMHLALTPDGPRGPRRRVQPGVVYLASRLGLPLVPTGFGFERPWRAGSWDRMVLPRPGTRARCVTGAPIAVPADADRERLELARRQLEAAIETATAHAQRWAETGTWPGPSSSAAA